MIRALGMDVSFWNGNVDFVKAKNAGISFVYIKASQLSADTKLATYRADAKSAGLPRGFYHYLDWRDSELKQAELFCNLLKDDPGELPPVVDFESKLFVPSQSIAQGKLWNFVQYVETTLHKTPMPYTGYYYWLQYGDPKTGWAKYPLWLPWYANENIVKVPPPWTKWTFWQYTGNGNGPQYGSQGLSLDMSWFNGTVDELQAFIGAPVPAPVQYAHTCPKCGWQFN